MGITYFIEMILEIILGTISFIWLATSFPKFFMWLIIIVLAIKIKEIIEIKTKGGNGNGKYETI
ncbi:MAG: hypothetical protein LKJ75_05060 [Clostridia bacterium]|jgi:hypothetical protein|nr:hypothetical protein [Clostridia bacterium]MCI2014552.1 hypothetical protein [Clostridia bacterium]